MYNDPGMNINPKQKDLPKPVVVAVNGVACGGALYMLGEADIIIAAEHATFFDPHVTYGMGGVRIDASPTKAAAGRDPPYCSVHTSGCRPHGPISSAWSQRWYRRTS